MAANTRVPRLARVARGGGDDGGRILDAFVAGGAEDSAIGDLATAEGPVGGWLITRADAASGAAARADADDSRRGENVGGRSAGDAGRQLLAMSPPAASRAGARVAGDSSLRLHRRSRSPRAAASTRTRRRRARHGPRRRRAARADDGTRPATRARSTQARLEDSIVARAQAQSSIEASTLRRPRARSRRRAGKNRANDRRRRTARCRAAASSAASLACGGDVRASSGTPDTMMTEAEAQAFDKARCSAPRSMATASRASPATRRTAGLIANARRRTTPTSGVGEAAAVQPDPYRRGARGWQRGPARRDAPTSSSPARPGRRTIARAAVHPGRGRRRRRSPMRLRRTVNMWPSSASCRTTSFAPKTRAKSIEAARRASTRTGAATSARTRIRLKKSTYSDVQTLTECAEHCANRRSVGCCMFTPSEVVRQRVCPSGECTSVQRGSSPSIAVRGHQPAQLRQEPDRRLRRRGELAAAAAEGSDAPHGAQQGHWLSSTKHIAYGRGSGDRRARAPVLLKPALLQRRRRDVTHADAVLGGQGRGRDFAFGPGGASQQASGKAACARAGRQTCWR